MDTGVSSVAPECTVIVHDGLHSYVEPNPVFAVTGVKTIGHGAAVVEPDGRVTLVAAPAWDAARLREEAACEVVGCDDVAAALVTVVGPRERVQVAGLDDVPVRFRQRLKAVVDVLVSVASDANRAKTVAELERARRAATIAEGAYARCLAGLRPGLREHELVARLDVDVRSRGADDHFVLISSSPQGDNVRAPTDRDLRPGDVVNIEISPSVDGQFVQICRTAVLGEASPERQAHYALLVEAFHAGMAASRTGAIVADVVAALDAPLVAAGLAEYCRPPHIRVRGHGQGLASLAPGDITWDNDSPLRAGVMFTLHPNQRFPRDGGYMLCGEPVLVGADGATPLTRRPPGLDEVRV
ncbi:MAG: M24 family metallopeptidase [Solirubrobacteraceae bacterium]